MLILLVACAWPGEISGLPPLLGALWGDVLLNSLSDQPPQLGGMLMLISDVFLALYFISVGLRVQAGDLLSPQGLGAELGPVGPWHCQQAGVRVGNQPARTPIGHRSLGGDLRHRGLPVLVFATTALTAGVINRQQFSAVVVMVTITTVIGLLLLERRLLRPRPDPNALI